MATTGCAYLVGAESPSNTLSPGLRPTSLSSGILIHPAFGHNRQGPKKGGCCAPFGGKDEELGPHLTQCGLGRGLPRTKCHLES